MSDSDPAAAYERLKIETARMLNLSADSASLVEGLQVDLVALLRLEIDTLQGAVLAGDSVDLGRLASALTMLRSLLPAQALVSAPPAAETRFGPNARQRLRDLIEKTVLRDDPYETERLRVVREREEQAAIAAALPVEATKAAPPPQSPRSDNVVPIDGAARANSALPPLGYLRDDQREPWRDYYDGRVTGPHPWPLPR
jgi:hypothetical protein